MQLYLFLVSLSDAIKLFAHFECFAPNHSWHSLPLIFQECCAFELIWRCCTFSLFLSHSPLSSDFGIAGFFFKIRMMNWMDSLNTVCLNFNAQWDIMIIYQKSMVPIFTSVFNIGRIFWKATISITTPTKQH